LTGTTIVYAPNVHTGGGLVLLQALLRTLPAGRVRQAFLDRRAQAQLPVPQGVVTGWVDATVPSRLAAELALCRANGHGDTVFCFHGLPPLLPNRGRVVVFLQNRLYLGRERPPSLALRTRLRLGFERQVARRLRRQVDAYIVQTPTMARALAAWFGEGAPSVRVLPFADEETLSGNGERATPPAWDFVYVADGEAHKNHRRLLEAWQLLAEAGLRPRLALTLSPRDGALAAEVARLRETAAIEVHDLGPLTRADVLALYRCTRALIFPSLSESFGLPLIEAHLLGTPVLAPELDYVRDVCDPVETFDPTSPQSIARSVRRFLGCAEPPVVISRPERLWAALDAP
jgi:glycosyltransferase involved in cell wall biosynthesis